MISRRKWALALNALALTAMFSVAPLASAQEAPKVKLATSMGDIVVQLNPEKAKVAAFDIYSYQRSAGYFIGKKVGRNHICLLYTSPSPRD